MILTRIFAGALALALMAAPARADQFTLVTPEVGSATMANLRTFLNNVMPTLAGCFSGNAVPAVAAGNVPVAYQCWADTSAAPVVKFKIYNPTLSSWVQIYSVNTTTGVMTPSNSVTQIVCGTGLTGGGITSTGTCAIDKATAANYYAGASNKVVTTDVVYTAEVALGNSGSGTLVLDTTAFVNAAVIMTGNISGVAWTGIAGKSGTIRLAQDATGNRTIVWPSALKWTGGSAPALSTAALAQDYLNYNCISATLCQASLAKNVQ
ncbi:hypothetical protein BjapCC829_22000 [Bradyrhizobium barranii]|uniref:Uncharacterized protein n=1 Tax=Bradyrhizobium barranii TaxID=2992140 RepID=A0ABY3QYH1_9BRAD|nr:hypothetical protein [Bradyrhizobium japonicum]UFW91064.1 hypothetical protein BjapCC829_22000 [Bradyrhizobium japonicum]